MRIAMFGFTLVLGAIMISGCEEPITEEQIEVMKGRNIANRFSMEYGICKMETNQETGELESIPILFEPGIKTAVILERWQEVHQAHPSIDYPEDLVQNNDWHAITDIYLQIKSTYGVDVSNYIIDGIMREDETIEDLPKP